MPEESTRSPLARSPRASLLAGGTLSLALYSFLALVGDLSAHLRIYLAVHAALFILFLVVVRVGAREASAGPILTLFAVAFRAVLIFSPPSLSDDLHRYVWDGRVQRAGINPYLHPPAADELAGLRDAGWAKINHREIRTLYPPLAEAVFLGAAAAGLRDTGFKAIFCLFDLATALALAGLLRRLGRAPSLAVIYAWNPLVVIEVAASGHVEPPALLLLVVSTGLIIGERRTLSIGAYAGAVLARMLPLGLLPIVVRRFKLHHLLLLAALIALGFAPYAGARGALFSGLATYAGNWDYNSVVFPAVKTALDALLPIESLQRLAHLVASRVGDPLWGPILETWFWPASVARILLGSALLVGTFAISHRVAAIEREVFLGIGLLLILSPTLHPWYLLWIVPFAAIEGSSFWILFTGLAPLSYLSLRTADGRVPRWVLAVEWGAPCVAALVARVRARLDV